MRTVRVRICGAALVSVVVTGLGVASPAGAGPSGPAQATRPTVTGRLQQGAKLTASPGTWTGSGTLSYAYQWYRCRPDDRCGDPDVDP